MGKNTRGVIIPRKDQRLENTQNQGVDREIGNTKIEWIHPRRKLEEMRVEGWRNQKERVSKGRRFSIMSRKSQE